MGRIIETIPGETYSGFDDRALAHNGCIVDLGCIRWNWSHYFFDKKRVIGADPYEQITPNGVDLFKGVVSSLDGLVKMNGGGDAANISTDINQGEWIPSISWKNFCSKYGIDEVSILKMNIEGAEYSLLHSMDTADFLKINQIIISFHDWLTPSWKLLTESSIYLLQRNGFSVREIGPYGWHLGIK